jgi:hypothetical protein
MKFYLPSEGRGFAKPSAVPPNQQLDVLYRSPRQVFDAFAANWRLVQAKVRHNWGKIEEQSFMAARSSSGKGGTLRNVPPSAAVHRLLPAADGPKSKSSRRSRKTTRWSPRW